MATNYGFDFKKKFIYIYIYNYVVSFEIFNYNFLK